MVVLGKESTSGASPISISLSSEFQQFVNVRVASGSYPSPEDVLRQAFQLLERREDLLKHIDEGTAQLRSRSFTEYDQASLRELCEEIKR